MAFNLVVLTGRLTAAPEIKVTPSGLSVCSFSIAVDRGYGENKTVDFINIVAWRQTAEFISKYSKKGSALCIGGSIQTRSWTDNNNQKRYATEVVVDEAMFVDGKNDSQDTEAPGFNNVAPNFTEQNVDDDLPF